MLRRQVGTVLPYRMFAGLGLGALIATTIVTAVRRPSVVLVPVPAPIAVPVPTPLPAPRARSPVHVGCPTADALMGIPAVATGPQAMLRGAAMSSDGCAVAIWSDTQLQISWDGGASFTAIDAALPEYQIVAFDDARFAWMPDPKTLEIVDAGAAAVRTVDVSWFGFKPDDFVSPVVGGEWIALRSPTQIYASRDGGATWTASDLPVLAEPRREPEPPQLWGIAADGTFDAVIREELRTSPDDPPPTIEHHFHRPASGGTWREVTPAAPTPPRGWWYTLDSDQNWGCGGTTKLVAHRGRASIELAAGLRDEIAPVAVMSGGGHSYAQHGDEIYELRAGAETRIDTDGLDAQRFLGVDANGGLLVRGEARLLRYTTHTGWRVLVSAARGNP